MFLMLLPLILWFDFDISIFFETTLPFLWNKPLSFMARSIGTNFESYMVAAKESIQPRHRVAVFMSRDALLAKCSSRRHNAMKWQHHQDTSVFHFNKLQTQSPFFLFTSTVFWCTYNALVRNLLQVIFYCKITSCRFHHSAIKHNQFIVRWIYFCIKISVYIQIHCPAVVVGSG